jgi:hypothetical protein
MLTLTPNQSHVFGLNDLRVAWAYTKCSADCIFCVVFIMNIETSPRCGHIAEWDKCLRTLPCHLQVLGSILYRTFFSNLKLMTKLFGTSSAPMNTWLWFGVRVGFFKMRDNY